MTHIIKIHPMHLKDHYHNNKNFEIRRDDRNYKTGDRIEMREYFKDSYSGVTLTKKIAFISDYEQRNNFVVLGLGGAE